MHDIGVLAYLLEIIIFRIVILLLTIQRRNVFNLSSLDFENVTNNDLSLPKYLINTYIGFDYDAHP